MKWYSLVAAIAAVTTAQEPPLLPINHLAIRAAADFNPTDSASEACFTAVSKVRECVSLVGDVEIITAASSILECACCLTGSQRPTPMADAYSSCSDYLSSRAPLLTSAYPPYGDLYSICKKSAACGKGMTATRTPMVTGTATPRREVTTIFSLPLGTHTESIGPLIPACSSMFGFYVSCAEHVSNFDNLPYGEQAPCYCCVVNRGATIWTDELDKHAQTCRNWASSGAPTIIYEVASTFASFCKTFSNACVSPTRTSAVTMATLTDVMNMGGTGRVQSVPTSASTSRSAAASNLRLSPAAGSAAGSAALAVALAAAVF
ncbi:hypothetical protein DCS_02548 [Drechmeria coniospora]|uniref:Uncharacterized protein n=1 Tax=Drechmeria coniospora TaxID=98403 RepID=A0A151GWC2_DRECN|nr:hypothetical protein DCS_02548 [Drechmeria coniospora]KYK61406.1 hypothetical protein DCS_02548 [Drechmeria coniospora]ODA81167.1 hypothetical protein RJ55_04131 [Drechmeria coniospora]